MLFLQEIDTATTEFRLSCSTTVVKRERLPYFIWFFQFSLLLKLVLCYYTLFVVILIILNTHLGREQGIGIILNFTAAMIVIEFDDITAKLFVTLKTRNKFRNFLQLQVEKKIWNYAEIRARKCYFTPVMKILAAFMSYIALLIAVNVDLSKHYKLIPAV